MAKQLFRFTQTLGQLDLHEARRGLVGTAADQAANAGLLLGIQALQG